MRIKRFDMTPEVLKFFFSGERFDMQATVNPLPADAELVRVNTNQNESSPRVISLFSAISALTFAGESILI